MKVFVFGSNLAGRHGAGAARWALENRGAVYGRGEGPQGFSYAVPTKDERLRPLPLYRIAEGVERFFSYARSNPNLKFQVTAIGCGLAGYKASQIAPLFSLAPLNCELPLEFLAELERSDQGW